MAIETGCGLAGVGPSGRRPIPAVKARGAGSAGRNGHRFLGGIGKRVRGAALVSAIRSQADEDQDGEQCLVRHVIGSAGWSEIPRRFFESWSVSTRL